MSQGLFSAVSGITANQQLLDVISDNIANMNTVGFKSGLLNFENVFSQTLSEGSAPSGNLGGTNPIQIGLGVKVGEVGRNFTNGTFSSTGRDTDATIEGNGFFTLQSTDGSMILTRAGNFTTDGEGNLVNAEGLKVIGTATPSSTTSGADTVKVPQSLKLVNTTSALASGDKISDICLDKGQLTQGNFTVSFTESGTTYSNTVAIGPSDTMSTVLGEISNMANYKNGSGSAYGGTGTIGASIGSDGKIDVNSSSISSLTFGGNSDTSNFLSLTGLNAAANTGTSPASDYTTAALNNNKISISAGDGSSNSYSMSSFSIGANGAITATYANGAKLTVQGDPREFLYTTSTGAQIQGNNIGINGNAVSPGELQIQMASVINTNGLVSIGGNDFSVGPNAGTPSYGVPGSSGMGSLKTGGLESSNVDLTSQFSNMILAQRGLEASSRSFNTESTILQTIVNLGRG